VTTTPPPPEQQSAAGYGDYGRGLNMGAMMPMPGNAELVVYVVAVVLVAIVALASNAVNSGAFVTSFTVLTLAYLVSRGIAKAGKVLER
jgi:hypothetical protein